MDAIQVPSGTSVGRHSKSAPCRTRRQTSASSRRSSDVSDSTDLHSVARSAPGDWSSGSLSRSGSGSEDSDKLFFSFPYASKTTINSGSDTSEHEETASCAKYDYEDDFDEDVDAFGEKYSSSSGSACKSGSGGILELSAKINEEEDIDALIARWRAKIQEEEVADMESLPETESSSDTSGYEDISNYRHNNAARFPGAEEGDDMKRFKMEVMKRLLAEFDLTETINRYRRMDARSYRLNPKDFSFDCSMEAQVFRDRIHTLTGSESLRINDPYYKDQLREKLRQEYELQQDKAERERAEGERERMRRLVTRGIIGAEELRNDRILSREYRVSHGLGDNKRKNKKRSKNRKPSPQRAKSAPQMTRQNKAVGYTRSPERKNRTNHARSHDFNKSHLYPGATYRMRSPESCYSVRRPATISCHLPLSGSFSADDSIASSSRRPMTSLPGRTARASMTSSTGDSEQDFGSNRPSSRSSYTRFKEHPIVQQMREEESLDGLYRLAAEIIPETEKEKQVLERTKTQEELDWEEENKYKNKKVVAKIRF